MRSSLKFLGVATARKPTNLKAQKQTRKYSSDALKRTPLYDLHVKLGGKMVPFCGWEMPVQYEDGILNSHLHCRTKASLFDVSHMGQVRVDGKDRAAFLEKLVVADLHNLGKDVATYSLFTNEKGGIIDDTIIANRGDWLYVVVNAGCFDKDKAHIDAHVGKEKDVKVKYMTERALLALQGPASEAVLSKLVHANVDLKKMKFMTGGEMTVAGIANCWVQRSGYTGEDGFEISVPVEHAVKLAEALLHNPDVKPCGLGARDSLRLEAGLCLYGNDLNETTTPKSANLVWAVNKARREKGGFLGADVILNEINNGVEPATRRIGLAIQGAPAREHATVHDPVSKRKIGEVTSGTFSPCLKKAIGMAYIETPFSKLNTEVLVEVRGKMNPAQVVKMPWVAHTYAK